MPPDRIGEGEAQGLSELIEVKKAPPGATKAATGLRCGSRPRSSESRTPPTPGCLRPAPTAARRPGPTLAEAAVLAVVGAQVAKRGACHLAVGHIAALAGVRATSVRNALRQAARLGLLSIEERRLSAFAATPMSLRFSRRNGGPGFMGDGGWLQICAAHAYRFLFSCVFTAFISLATW